MSTLRVCPLGLRAAYSLVPQVCVRWIGAANAIPWLAAKSRCTVKAPRGTVSVACYRVSTLAWWPLKRFQ
jgi:hypothetical protein